MISRAFAALALAALMALVPQPVRATLDAAVFVQEWGVKSPTLPGHFYVTVTSAVHDATGDVYVLENYRVQKFTRDGDFILEFSCQCFGVDVYNGVDDDDRTNGDVYVSHDRSHQISQYTSAGSFVRQWGSFGSGPGQFNSPVGVAVDAATGNVYVMDSGNARVQIFDSTGTYLSEFGSPGFTGSQRAPGGIAFDPLWRVVWVTDARKHIVEKFDEFGAPLLRLGQANVESGAPGLFRWPRAVAVDGVGDVYVIDTDNHRLQRFGTDGTFIEIIQGPHDTVAGPFHPRDVAINLITGEKFANAAYAWRMDRFDASNNYLSSFGDRLVDGHYLLLPLGIATSPVDGDIYVWDTMNFRIKRFTAGGAILKSFASFGPDFGPPGMLSSFVASALAVDPDGNFYGGDANIHYATAPPNQFVRKFDEDGNLLLAIERTDLSGSYDERIKHLAVDPVTRDIWVSDSTSLKRVKKFDQSGNLLLEILDPGDPLGIAVSGTNVYVADQTGNLIRKYDTSGNPLGTFGGTGSGDGLLNLDSSTGIAVDGSSNVYVADTDNDRIQQFDPNGVFMGKTGVAGNFVGGFLQPVGVALSPDSSLLHVVDRAAHKVVSFCLGDVAVCTAQMDFDSDTKLDAGDNCPFVPNPLQLDAGGIGTVVADGIGDECQCGDASGDHKVDALDISAIRTDLVGGGAPVSPPLCSVTGATECDLLDVVVLERGLALLGPGIQQVCAPAIRP